MTCPLFPKPVADGPSDQRGEGGTAKGEGIMTVSVSLSSDSTRCCTALINPVTAIFASDDRRPRYLQTFCRTMAFSSAWMKGLSA